MLILGQLMYVVSTVRLNCVQNRLCEPCRYTCIAACWFWSRDPFGGFLCSRLPSVQYGPFPLHALHGLWLVVATFLAGCMGRGAHRHYVYIVNISSKTFHRCREPCDNEIRCLACMAGIRMVITISFSRGSVGVLCISHGLRFQSFV